MNDATIDPALGHLPPGHFPPGQAKKGKKKKKKLKGMVISLEHDHVSAYNENAIAYIEIICADTATADALAKQMSNYIANSHRTPIIMLTDVTP